MKPPLYSIRQVPQPGDLQMNGQRACLPSAHEQEVAEPHLMVSQARSWLARTSTRPSRRAASGRSCSAAQRLAASTAVTYGDRQGGVIPTVNLPSTCMTVVEGAAFTAAGKGIY